MTQNIPQLPGSYQLSAISFRLLCSVLCALFSVALTHATPIKFDIPAQAADTALQIFIKQAGAEVMFDKGELKAVKSNAVVGEFEVPAALDALLEGTGFRAGRRASGLFTVSRVVAAKPGSIEGTVREEGSGKAVAGAKVQIAGTENFALTDKRGRFTLEEVPAGAHVLEITASGMQRTKVTDIMVRSGYRQTLSTIEVPALVAGVEQMEPYIVSAKKNDGVIEMDPYAVEGRKERPFVTNMDIPRTINDARPYYIFDAKTIDQSGVANVEDFLKQRLTMNTVSSSFGQMNNNNLGNISQVNLRGLGTNKTLILINGRRVTDVNISGEAYQTDINGIPLSAIDRIEVLPTSASGVYGGSAIGGVVNLVLKKQYAGGELRVTYENTWDSDTPTRTLAASYGFSLEGGRTQVMLSGQVSDRVALRQQDRLELMERGHGMIASNTPEVLNSPNAVFLGAFPNISGGTANLVLRDGRSLGSPLTSVPSGTTSSTPALILADGLLANAGAYNLDFPATSQPNTGLLSPFGSDREAQAFLASVRRRMSERVQAFAEFSLNRNRSERETVLISSVSVPANSVINPFNRTVSVSLPNNVANISSNDVQVRVLTLGLNVSLLGDWNGQADFTRSETHYQSRYFISDFASFSAAILNGGFNPFVDSVQHPPDIAKYSVPQDNTSRGAMDDFAVRASGSLWRLPAGPLSLTAGLQRRIATAKESTFVRDFPLRPSASTVRVFFGQRQTTDSAYAEMNVPFVSKANAMPFLKVLDVQVAGRVERSTVRTGTPGATINAAGQISYQTPTINGQPFSADATYDSFDPTVGLRISPFNGFILRASYGTAFLPPTYQQLLPNPVPDSFLSTIFDPVRNATYAIQTTSGGNPDITPLNSESVNVGVIWEPQQDWMEGWRFNVDYYEIDQRDVIGQLSAQQLVTLESDFPDRVTRDAASGQITMVNTRLQNLTRQRTKGLDLSVSVSRTIGSGKLHAAALATRIFSEMRQPALNAPMLDYVGYVGDGGPGKFKGSGSLVWETGRWTAGWSTQYYNSYKVQLAPGGPNGTGSTVFTRRQGGENVASQMYHDAFLNYTFRDSSSVNKGWLNGTTIHLGIKNVFNKAPPFDAAATGHFYVSTYGDVRLRTYQLSVRKQF